MKNKYTFLSATALFAIVLMNLSPLSASANILNVDLNGSVKTEVKGHDNERDNDNRATTSVTARLHATTSATSTASSTKDKDRDEVRDGQLPPGIQHAPGIEKRIEDGKGLPKGILGWFTRWFGHKNATSTPTTSTAALMIRDVAVVAGTSTATVSWITGTTTSGEVRFDTIGSIATSSPLVIDSSASTTHTVTLTGLTADTNYYMVITARDLGGNVKTSSVVRFHTNAVSSDVTAPTVLFSTTVDVSTSSARIVWLTNERSDSRVWVSTSTPVTIGATSTIAVSNTTNLVYLHSVTVTGLATSTPYFFALKSADSNSNVSATTTGSFTTTH